MPLAFSKVMPIYRGDFVALGETLLLYLGNGEFDFKVSHFSEEKCIPLTRRWLEPSASPSGEAIRIEEIDDRTWMAIYTNEGMLELSTGVNSHRSEIRRNEDLIMVFNYPDHLSISIKDPEDPSHSYHWRFWPVRL